jgi:hypothetical protein
MEKLRENKSYKGMEKGLVLSDEEKGWFWKKLNNLRPGLDINLLLAYKLLQTWEKLF